MTHDPLQELFDSIDSVKYLSDTQLDAQHPTTDLLDRLHHDIATESVSWFRRKVWRRTAIVTVSSVLVLAGTAAAITILRSPVQVTTSMSCFRADSLHSGADVIAYSDHPLAACQSVMHWSSGLSTKSKGLLCVLSNGSLAGFPLRRIQQRAQQSVCPHLMVE